MTGHLFAAEQHAAAEWSRLDAPRRRLDIAFAAATRVGTVSAGRRRTP
ncbi:hypothetical protein [Dactylosporangium sp. NPDC006015]